MIPKVWNEKTYEEFSWYLKSLKDDKYREFSQGLCISKYEMLGIRIPILRKIAKQIKDISFLDVVLNNYFEEVMLEGLVIANIKDEKLFYKYFKKYIKKIDDWSLCDTFCNSIKIVRKYQDKYFKEAIKLCKSDKEYIVRVGLIIILDHFIYESNLKDILETVDNIKLDKYYINMAQAWLICELYISYPEEIEKYLKNNHLSKFTHNKAISKIRESFRVSQSQKDYLNTLKKV